MSALKFVIILSALINYISLTFGQDISEDEIKDLPGLNHNISYRHYSGYLAVSENHRLHYWFVESESDPSKDPLVFWFNGGPGCSSIGAGLLKELGPYLVDSHGKSLDANPHAWNKFASVVFIEAPAGVGYSYSTDGNVTTNDDLTASENYEAVKQFLKKFPAFRNHTVFITGESYAGIYIPMLASRIVDGQQDYPLNLKGIAIGNGVLDENMNVDTMIRFAYSHGIIGETYFHKLLDTCCPEGCTDKCQLAFNVAHNLQCVYLVLDTYNFLWTTGLNTYDIFRKCDGNSKLNSERFRVIQESVLADPKRKEKLSEKDELQKKNVQKDDEDEEEGHDIPCLDDRDVNKYLNSPEVRKALNIPEELARWSICRDQTFYTKTRKDMKPYIENIIRGDVRILLFYGDTDMACNFLMGEQFSANLGLKEIGKQDAWRYRRQIAGYKTTYEKGVTFLTILGAGHMAPAWRAAETSYAIKKFIDDQPI
ncbi:serine carboxypeptidase domain-containing protein [Ditylenchus destructor]|nr:serine carboxypeptidase domain-containing protein [Ditylenchus destructor]